jgi:phosphatidylglycerol---prolipoprotein diacylglyceryl transferase
MLPEMTLGPLVLPSAGLVYIIGAWLTLSIVERAARSMRLDAEQTYTLASITLGAGLVGARLIFVALHWSAYRQNVLGILWPLTSGYHVLGGLLAAGAAGLLYGRARQLPPWATLDALAPGVLVAFMAVSLADFLAGPGYGTESALPWAIDVFGISRHPVQIYELLAGGAALLVWLRLSAGRQYPSQLILAAAAVYSGGRLFVDAFRANAWLSQSGFHVVQILSLVVLLSAVYLMSRKAPVADDVAGP